MKKLFFTLAFSACLAFVYAQSSTSSFDNYVNASQDNVYDVIAKLTDQISNPNDLDFNPNSTNGSEELWVINEGTANSGGSTVTILNAGKSNQTTTYKKDGNSWHFMSMPTGMAFGDDGTWANSPGIYDANHKSSGTPFTGPALWEGDLSIYAKTPPGGNGSHLDMLHESPRSMGIAHEKNNVYWVNDGENATIVMYDFGQDHGPGKSYHGDGKVAVYSDVSVKRDATGIPGHVVLDKVSKWLYICDTGNGRILRMNVESGTKKGNLSPIEFGIEKWSMKDVVWEEVATGLSKPCGVDVFGDRLVVTDNGTGEIIIYDLSGTAVTEVGRTQVTHSTPNIRGIKVDAQGQIWFVEYGGNKVYRLSNSKVLGVNVFAKVENKVSVYPNPANNELNIRYTEDLEVSKISILDAQGRRVFATQNQDNKLNVEALNSGLYFIQIEAMNGSILSQKFYKN